MASSLQHQLLFPDRVGSGSMLSTQTRPRGSKSQMCLHKILRIITTVPPLPPTSSTRFSSFDTKESTADNDSNDGDKRSGFDLNVGFRLSPDTLEFLEADGSGLSSSSSTGAGGAVLGGGVSEFVNLHGGGDRTEKDESDQGLSANESYHIKVEEKGDSLSLLVEAAKLVFGEFKENDKSESESEPGDPSISRVFNLEKDGGAAADIKPPNTRQLRRRSYCWTAAEMGAGIDEPPSSPVVKSKRGRTQVLPCKYRDSVLQPLTQSRNRSSALPTKRRRR